MEHTMEHTDVSDPSTTGEAAGATGRQRRIAQLEGEFHGLRDRLLRLKGDYEAGRVTLDEEIALVRGIERELVAARAAINALEDEGRRAESRRAIRRRAVGRPDR